MNRSSVLKNASWIISVKILQSLLAVVISMITARYLGPANFGLINYASAIIAFALPIAYLGINSILVQELVSKPEKEGEILGTAIGSCFVSSLICILGIFVFVFILNYDEPITIAVCLLYSFSLITQVFEMIQYWFQAKLLSKYTAVISAVMYVVISIYKIFLLVTVKSIEWFAIANALDYGLIAICLHIIYRKLGGQKLSYSFVRFKYLFNKSKYYIISGIMVTIFAQTDRVMLKMMINETATGFYSAAVATAGLTSFFFSAIIDSGRPAIFDSLKIRKSLFEKNVKRLYSVVIYLALLQSAIICLFAPLIILILYGHDYFPAIDVLRIVVWYTTFSYIGAVRNIWMLAENKQRYIWMIDLSGALFNVILNVLLIHFFGVIGAAIASLFTQIFTNVIVGFILPPMRHNNRLMIESLNPKYILEMLRFRKR